MKKNLNITFSNPNTEDEIVQAIAGVIAYNLLESNEKIKFDFKNTFSKKSSEPFFQDSCNEKYNHSKKI